MPRGRKRGVPLTASDKGAPLNSPGDSSSANVLSSLASLSPKLKDCRFEFRNMTVTTRASLRKNHIKSTVREVQSPPKCLRSQITDFFAAKKAIGALDKDEAGFDSEPPVLKRFDEDDDGIIIESSAEDKEMPWILPQPKEDGDQGSEQSEGDGSDSGDASGAGSTDSDRPIASKTQIQAQKAQKTLGKNCIISSSYPSPQLESTRVVTRSRAALVHKQIPQLSLNPTSLYVTPPSPPCTRHRASATSAGNSPAAALSSPHTATAPSPPMLHKIKLVDSGSKGGAASSSEALENLKISSNESSASTSAPLSPKNVNNGALDNRANARADTTSQRQAKPTTNGAVGQNAKKTSSTILRSLGSAPTKGPKKSNGGISSVPKHLANGTNSNHQPSNKLVAAATGSHKVTEFFPIRRSERKPKRALEEEQLKDVESHLLTEDDDMRSDIHVEYFPKKGRGVVALRDFHKGEFVVEYAGDLLDIGMAKEREETYSLDLSTGCYMYYFKHKGKQYCIDATTETGRFGRLVNHSRVSPNLQPKVVELNEKPRLILVAKKYIAKDEELLYDYGDRSKESLIAHPWLAS